jgi:hypothetical protein
MPTQREKWGVSRWQQEKPSQLLDRLVVFVRSEPSVREIGVG